MLWGLTREYDMGFEKDIILFCEAIIRNRLQQKTKMQRLSTFWTREIILNEDMDKKMI